jgi:triacylglycerol esterase/lipase EstA (alpha/beta hydrolase family)
MLYLKPFFLLFFALIFGQGSYGFVGSNSSRLTSIIIEPSLNLKLNESGGDLAGEELQYDDEASMLDGSLVVEGKKQSFSSGESLELWPGSFLFSEYEMDQLLEIEDVCPELSLDGRKPLLLIHGWSFDGTPAAPGGGYWDNFKDYLLNDSTLSANFKPYYVKYWSNAVPVDEIAEALRDELENQEWYQQKMVIVAHSMGGLVARSFMNEQCCRVGDLSDLSCGDNIDLLVTLGTPHHGSPMANGPARNAELPFFVKLVLSNVESVVFNDISYDEINRSDLWWDNYDNLFDLESYPDENNLWLNNLNEETEYDSRTICYAGSVDGLFIIPESGNTTQEYLLGAWFTDEGLDLENDGIVPIKSAAFEGHSMKLIRYFEDYNHADIIKGKEDESELFDSLKNDLMDVAPLRFVWPDGESILSLSYLQTLNVKWVAPSTLVKLNFYLSVDNGRSYTMLAADVDASLGQYQLALPDVNSDSCFIKLVNSDYEQESITTSLPFTIYHNKITIAAPSETSYFVQSKANTISWEQEGVGDKVKITYVDTVTQIEQLVVDGASTNVGFNSYAWNISDALPATTNGLLDIQLQGLQESIGDTQTYVFRSESFQLFGDPDFEFLSPDSDQVDFFGTKGEQLEIGSAYSIDWKAYGEVKYVEFFLCDKNKNQIEQIDSIYTVPAVEVEGITEWTVPAYYGDEFYLSASVGLSADSILFDSYSTSSFRINERANIISPVSNDSVDLCPCFEVNVSGVASSYSIIIGDSLLNDQNIKWEYESTEDRFCVPNKIENELTPGQTYWIVAAAQFDSVCSFTDDCLFYTRKIAPESFRIISPAEDDSIDGNELSFLWTRSLGAAYYTLELMQKGELIYSADRISSMDTFRIVTIDNQYLDVLVELAAVNSYGEATTSLELYGKENITNVGNVASISSESIYLRNYPNPFDYETTFEFYVSDLHNAVRLELYDLSGEKLVTIIEGDYLPGEYRVLWKRDVRFEGCCLCRLTVNGSTRTRLLLMD